MTQCDYFLQGQNEQKDKEMSQLVKEMDQMKEQHENLKSLLQQQMKETDNLKVCLRVFGLRVNSVLLFRCEN